MNPMDNPLPSRKKPTPQGVKPVSYVPDAPPYGRAYGGPARPKGEPRRRDPHEAEKKAVSELDDFEARHPKPRKPQPTRTLILDGV